MSSQFLLVIAVLVVGVLHTLVPDHWVPITLIARQRGWSIAQTARAAAIAGLGHTLSTLAIAIILWLAGVAFARHFGQVLNLITSLALIGFGAWVALGAIREVRAERGSPRNGSDAVGGGHAHLHRHESGLTHVHWHTHNPTTWHTVEKDVALAPPLHEHDHPTSGRTAMVLILGSSPMVEGIPAFFAASRFGAELIIIMSIVFALSTITTYVALCVAPVAGLQRIQLGPLERYGEVISGSFIALLGVTFMFIH